MKLLAIDTSSNACSVAIRIDNDIFENHVVEPREHTKILMPMITELLGQAAVTLQELDALVLGNGPGSFIGMRIGASVVQGLCYGAGLNVIPVSSLEAVAAEVFDEHAAGQDVERVIVAQDAHMKEVYVGVFGKGHDGLPVPQSREAIVPVGTFATMEGRFLAAGDAWNRYPGLLRANELQIAGFLPVAFPRARYLLHIGAKAIARAISPQAVSPAYLRMKVAEKPRPGA